MPYTVKVIYGMENTSASNSSVTCASGTYAATIRVYGSPLNNQSVDSLGLVCSDGAVQNLDQAKLPMELNSEAYNSDFSGIFGVAGYWLDSMYFFIDGTWQNYGGADGDIFYQSLCGGNNVIAGFTNVYYDSSNSYIASFDIICSTPCPAGRYGASSCDLCPAGSYSYYGSYECTLCPAGTYSSATGANSSDACLPCPSGTFSSALGATSISSCAACPAGFISDIGASTCSACEKNNAGGCLPYTISGVSGHEAAGSFNATCRNGTYAAAIVIFTDVDNNYLAGLGVYCSDGFYSYLETYSSFQFLLAYNNDLSGFTSTSGKAGFYVDSMALQMNGQLTSFGGTGGSSSYSIRCSGDDVIVGFTNVHEDSDQFQYLAGFDIVCGTPCPAGHYGASNCDPCPAGSYSDYGSYECTLCAEGYYSSSVGQSACTACPSGTYSTVIGATSSDTCLACPSGANAYTQTYIVRK